MDPVALVDGPLVRALHPGSGVTVADGHAFNDPAVPQDVVPVARAVAGDVFQIAAGRGGTTPSKTPARPAMTGAHTEPTQATCRVTLQGEL